MLNCTILSKTHSKTYSVTNERIHTTVLRMAFWLSLMSTIVDATDDHKTYNLTRHIGEDFQTTCVSAGPTDDIVHLHRTLLRDTYSYRTSIRSNHGHNDGHISVDRDGNNLTFSIRNIQPADEGQFTFITERGVNVANYYLRVLNLTARPAMILTKEQITHLSRLMPMVWQGIVTISRDRSHNVIEPINTRDLAITVISTILIGIILVVVVAITGFELRKQFSSKIRSRKCHYCCTSKPCKRREVFVI